MAEAALTYVGKQALSNLINLLPYDFEDLKIFWGFEEELNKLRESIDAIAELVEDAEQKQVTRVAERRWLRNLKDVAYEADDLLDELAYETIRLEIQNEEVNNFSPILKPIGHFRSAGFRFKMAHKLKKVTKSLQNIQRDSQSLQLRLIQSNVMDIMSQNRIITDSVLDNPVVGREADVLKIVNLLNGSCHQQVTVVPIIGLGGLGKTALAKLVCQKVMETGHFDVKLWVCVSSKFSEKRILKEMLEQLNPEIGGLTNTDAILQQLEKELRTKTFLLVLDDVWDDFSAKWNFLKARLLEACTNSGNAIIVTTRSKQVASNVDASAQHWHKLGLLSDDECWSILKERACRNVGTSITSNLEAIGKEIARKCKGVPLAAKVLGGAMGCNRDEQSWFKIRDSKVLNAKDDEENIESILKLSFDHLPSSLKPCFAFCSIFPKDFSIRKQELVLLWMAEGLVKSFDEGNKYFEALLANSFFQDVERDDDGDVIKCKMHDLVHDLAFSLSKFEILTRDNFSNTDRTSFMYRLYADGQFVTTSMAIPEGRAKKLRTVILKNAPYHRSWKLESLRTLHLNGDAIEVLPSSIGEMKHLRYLDISKSRIKVLPESITKLYNLQTLKFLECYSLTDLPRNKINNLINLKHLDFSLERHMPYGLWQLCGLEILPRFVVGPDRGGSIRELECLNELGGGLEISRLEEVKDRKEAQRANLQGKPKLQALALVWSAVNDDFAGFTSDEIKENHVEVLEGLQPHPNIKKLLIRLYLGDKIPSWMSRMKRPNDVQLNNLVDLSLSYCYCCEQLPTLGNLPCLKSLQLIRLDKVKSIDNEFYGIASEGNCSTGRLRLFPALKTLSFRGMHKFIEWRAPSLNDTDGDIEVIAFPCLQELSINGCSRLEKIPLSDLSSLVKLGISGCDKLNNVLDELQCFHSLTSVFMENCTNLPCLPNGLISSTCMNNLCIRGCIELTSIPEGLGKLNSLISLEITHCGRLSYFPEEIFGNLTQLKKLKVGRFSEELDDFCYLNRIKDLPCLEELEIWASYRSTVCQLPYQLQYLTALKSLSIREFKEMEVLPEWFSNLQSLQSLNLFLCHKLEYEQTATIIRRLSNLRALTIFCCALLKRNKSEWLEFSRQTKIKVS